MQKINKPFTLQSGPSIKEYYQCKPCIELYAYEDPRLYIYEESSSLRYQCGHCGREFENLNKRDLHMRYDHIHEIKVFHCIYCGKTFKCIHFKEQHKCFFQYYIAGPRTRETVNMPPLTPVEELKEDCKFGRVPYREVRRPFFHFDRIF